MEYSEIREITDLEIDAVTGAVNWGNVATGLAVVSAGAFILAAAPATGGASLYVGAALLSGGGHIAVISALVG